MMFVLHSAKRRGQSARCENLLPVFCLLFVVCCLLFVVRCLLFDNLITASSRLTPYASRLKPNHYCSHDSRYILRRSTRSLISIAIR